MHSHLWAEITLTRSAAVKEHCICIPLARSTSGVAFPTCLSVSLLVTALLCCLETWALLLQASWVFLFHYLGQYFAFRILFSHLPGPGLSQVCWFGLFHFVDVVYFKSYSCFKFNSKDEDAFLIVGNKYLARQNSSLSRSWVLQYLARIRGCVGSCFSWLHNARVSRVLCYWPECLGLSCDLQEHVWVPTPSW